ncbi:MAG: FAD:protein FMN transferase [Candidatus Aminicenantes bacterium]|nr:FAD:protein FMN transferase [Candidatus Aminicenantes bacterium]
MFEVVAAGKDEAYARQAARAAFDEINRLERLFSRFDPSSEVSRLSRLGPGESLRIGVETFECLKVAAQVQAETAGAFDVNIQIADRRNPPRNTKKGPSPREAGKAARARHGRRPLPNLLDLLELEAGPAGFRAVRREEFATAPLGLDLGGIGKGYALERALDVLRDWDLRDVLLHAGTSTALASGTAPTQLTGRAGWPVSVATAWPGVDAPRTVVLRDFSVSGSGTEVKGGHILDPRTGRPARGHRAAWAAHRSAAFSDALATAFMVMPTEEVAAYSAARPDVWALVISGPKTCKIFNERVLEETPSEGADP